MSNLIIALGVIVAIAALIGLADFGREKFDKFTDEFYNPS